MIAMITYFTGGFGAGPAALATLSGETVIQISAAAVIYAEAVVIAKEAAKATISIASQMPKISFDIEKNIGTIRIFEGGINYIQKQFNPITGLKK